MRWLERRAAIEAFQLLPDLRNLRNAARQRIRGQKLPDPASDGWFTISVKDVIKTAADLRAGASEEVWPIHILAAMVLPARNPHDTDIKRIVRNKDELIHLVSVRALEQINSFNRDKLSNINPAVVEAFKPFETDVSSALLTHVRRWRMGKGGRPSNILT